MEKQRKDSVPTLPLVGAVFRDYKGNLWEVSGTGGSATHREIALRLVPKKAV